MARKKTRPFSRTIRMSTAQKKILQAMRAYFGQADPDEPITETEIVANWTLRGMLASWRDTSELMDRIEKDPTIEVTPKMIKQALKDPVFKHDVDGIDYVLTGMKSNLLFAELLKEVERQKDNDGSSGVSPSDSITKFFRARKPHPEDEVIVLYPPNDVFR